MTKKQEADDAGRRDAKPAGGSSPTPPPPDDGAAAKRAAKASGFLPDDSFLLEIDDASARSAESKADRAPADDPNEEWLLVDDDALAAEPAPAAEPMAAEAAIAGAFGAAPATKTPGWYTQDESPLPTFAASESETAMATQAAPERAAAAAVATAPPVRSLATARRRPRMLAAAGLLVALGAGAALVFEMRRRGAESESIDVASRPRPAWRKPAEPSVAVAQPEPSTVPSPPVSEPAAAALAPELVAVAPPSPEREFPIARREPAPTPPTPPDVVDPPRKRPLPPLNGAKRPPAPARKDDTIVELRNGHTFRGQITRAKGARVALRIGSGECEFDLAEVTLLDSTAPEYRRADQMPEASVVLVSGQRLRGRLLKQSADRVVLVVDRGQLVVPRADVKEVSFTGRIHF